MRLDEVKHESYTGEKNSQFGTVWLHRGTESKKVKASDVESNLTDGWNLGRKPKEPPRPRKKVTLTCIRCSAPFQRRRADREFCPVCAKLEGGKKSSITRRERGTFSGWHYRKGETSYPERYLEDVFSQESIVGWVREKKVGRWFIDFAFEQQKIAVEMDGRQHDERADQDKKKDDFLTSQGWKVIRIKWFNPRTEQGKQKLHPQIQSLLKILRGVA